MHPYAIPGDEPDDTPERDVDMKTPRITHDPEFGINSGTQPRWENPKCAKHGGMCTGEHDGG